MFRLYSDWFNGPFAVPWAGRKGLYLFSISRMFTLTRFERILLSWKDELRLPKVSEHFISGVKTISSSSGAIDAVKYSEASIISY